MTVMHPPDGVERFGRRLKMEYVGMASVFLTIWLVHFRDPAALLATFFLFVGLKKKTRDHLVTSLLMFAAAALAVPAVHDAAFGIPLALFAALACALEGWIEKRPIRIVAVPILLGLLPLATPLWPLGLVFAAAYVLAPAAVMSGSKRTLVLHVAAGALLALATALAVGGGAELAVIAPSSTLRTLTVAIAVPTLVALVAFRRELVAPHRVNAILTGALAPWDARAAALFGLAATIVLAATLFRQSVWSSQLRPHFRRAEWYYFWVILAVALGLLLRYGHEPALFRVVSEH